MKDREVKTKREIDELFFKPIIESVDDMDINVKKEMKKIRPIKNTWYDWLINYIPEPIRKIFKTNTPKQTVYGRGKKLSKPSKQNIKKPFISEENKHKNKDRIIIWILFETEEKGETKNKNIMTD